MQHPVRCIKKECRQCGRAFVANRTTTLYCSPPCKYNAFLAAHPNPNAPRDAKRAARQRKAQVMRPRCVVCFNPIRYGSNGVRLDARTCGKRYCVGRAHDWFGPMKPRRKAA